MKVCKAKRDETEVNEVNSNEASIGVVCSICCLSAKCFCGSNL